MTWNAVLSVYLRLLEQRKLVQPLKVAYKNYPGKKGPKLHHALGWCAGVVLNS